MNKFNVNTSPIPSSEIGFFLVNGGKIHCTVNEFVDMHSSECIEECDDTLYYLRNKVAEKVGYPIGRVSIGKHHPESLSEKKNCYTPMWEGSEFVCYVDMVKQEISLLNDTVNGENIQKTVYETDFDFIIESWGENKFYPRKPL